MPRSAVRPTGAVDLAVNGRGGHGSSNVHVIHADVPEARVCPGWPELTPKRSLLGKGFPPHQLTEHPAVLALRHSYAYVIDDLGHFSDAEANTAAFLPRGSDHSAIETH